MNFSINFHYFPLFQQFNTTKHHNKSFSLILNVSANIIPKISCISSGFYKLELNDKIDQTNNLYEILMINVFYKTFKKE